MKKKIALFFTALMIFCLTACSSSDYKEALLLKDEGRYSDAVKILKKIESYKDSKDLINECNYQIALELFEQGKYDEIIELLPNEEGSDDSKELLKSAKYEKSLELIDQFNYKEAEIILAELGNYKDAATLAKECGKSFNPEEFNQRLIKIIDGADSSVSFKIRKNDSLYDLYIESKKVGNLSYNHIDENGDAQDEGMINHVVYLEMLSDSNKSDVEAMVAVWEIMAPCIMCALDDSYNDDMQMALNDCKSYLSKALTNLDSYKFNNNGYYYSAIAIVTETVGAWLGFGAGTVDF